MWSFLACWVILCKLSSLLILLSMTRKQFLELTKFLSVGSIVSSSPFFIGCGNDSNAHSKPHANNFAGAAPDLTGKTIDLFSSLSDFTIVENYDEDNLLIIAYDYVLDPSHIPGSNLAVLAYNLTINGEINLEGKN